jgi:hypothetical protein
MRIYRRYHCDYGHTWEVSSKADQPRGERENYCRDGHEAVTCEEHVPADEVQVLLRPAARVVDRVKGTVHNSDRYFLVLLDRSDEPLRVSAEHYGWDEALKLALLFRGKDTVRALQWWKRRFPNDPPGRSDPN